jgi:hypothetical protein
MPGTAQRGRAQHRRAGGARCRRRQHQWAAARRRTSSPLKSTSGVGARKMRAPRVLRNGTTPRYAPRGTPSCTHRAGSMHRQHCAQQHCAWEVGTAQKSGESVLTKGRRSCWAVQRWQAAKLAGCTCGEQRRCGVLAIGGGGEEGDEGWASWSVSGAFPRPSRQSWEGGIDKVHSTAQHTTASKIGQSSACAAHPPLPQHAQLPRQLLVLLLAAVPQHIVPPWGRLGHLVCTGTQGKSCGWGV